MKLHFWEGKFRIFIITLPLAALAGLIKVGLHHLQWEPFNIPVSPFFTTILTGIIFLLGFILAGVLSDYKQSEAIPEKLAAGLYSLWQETEILLKNKPSGGGLNLQKKICSFVEVLRTDFLLKRREEGVMEVLDSFSEDFNLMDQEGVAPPLMGRLRGEQANIALLLYTIKRIRDTSFLESGYVIIQSIITAFTFTLMLTKFEVFEAGLFFMCFCIFILWSIFLLLKDMDDPFEYQEGKSKPDEISFQLLFQLEEKLKSRMAS